MNKIFIYGLFAGFVILSVYKSGISLLNKPGNAVQEEIPLSLIDINFTRDSNTKGMPDYVIKHHQDEEKSLKLANLKGKPVVLHFWATWCEPCKKELPYYNKFIASNSDIVHVALTPDGTTKEKIVAFFAQNGLKNIPVMTDDSGIISKFFDVKAFPTTLFINKEGVLVGRVIGIVDWQDPKTMELLLQTFAS